MSYELFFGGRPRFRLGSNEVEHLCLNIDLFLFALLLLLKRFILFLCFYQLLLILPSLLRPLSLIDRQLYFYCTHLLLHSVN